MGRFALVGMVLVGACVPHATFTPIKRQTTMSRSEIYSTALAEFVNAPKVDASTHDGDACVILVKDNAVNTGDEIGKTSPEVRRLKFSCGDGWYAINYENTLSDTDQAPQRFIDIANKVAAAIDRSAHDSGKPSPLH